VSDKEIIASCKTKKRILDLMDLDSNISGIAIPVLLIEKGDKFIFFRNGLPVLATALKPYSNAAGFHYIHAEVANDGNSKWCLKFKTAIDSVLWVSPQ
jgi:hypothetical protein